MIHWYQAGAPPLTIRGSPFEVLALSLFSATMDIWKSSPTKAKPGKLPPMAGMPSELEYPGYTPNISPKKYPQYILAQQCLAYKEIPPLFSSTFPLSLTWLLWTWNALFFSFQIWICISICFVQNWWKSKESGVEHRARESLWLGRRVGVQGGDGARYYPPPNPPIKFPQFSPVLLPVFVFDFLFKCVFARPGHAQHFNSQFSICLFEQSQNSP